MHARAVEEASARLRDLRHEEWGTEALPGTVVPSLLSWVRRERLRTAYTSAYTEARNHAVSREV
jgi:hypothetical protein